MSAWQTGTRGPGASADDGVPDVVAPPPLGVELLELLLLLPHPASASSATEATDASPIRIRGMR